MTEFSMHGYLLIIILIFESPKGGGGSRETSYAFIQMDAAEKTLGLLQASDS